MKLQDNGTGSPSAKVAIPSPADPQAYFKLLVGGPKRTAQDAGGRSGSLAPAVLSAAFRDAADRAGRRFAEARRRLAA